ncbi:MAG: hypothetical protein H6Q82_2648 [Deltaproteobacteria bacterium]|nr:hypothetical protein [Deltaproteobacteria bacterium]
MMKPLAKRFVLFLFVCFFLPASCATTKMTDTWRDDTYRGTIRKVVVIGIFKEPDTRKIFEDEFADRLRARGVDATASHKIVSDAELPDKDVVIGNVRKHGADGVMVTRVVDMETEKTSVPGQTYIVPTYYTYYGAYYGYSYRPGYTETTGYAYMETNLYGLGDEKLIWSGRSKTKISATRYELIQAFVKTMLDGLSEAKLIR